MYLGEIKPLGQSVGRSRIGASAKRRQIAQTGRPTELYNQIRLKSETWDSGRRSGENVMAKPSPLRHLLFEEKNNFDQFTLLLSNNNIWTGSEVFQSISCWRAISERKSKRKQKRRQVFCFCWNLISSLSFEEKFQSSCLQVAAAESVNTWAAWPEPPRSANWRPL